jgi:hypothetical protein
VAAFRRRDGRETAQRLLAGAAEAISRIRRDQRDVQARVGRAFVDSALLSRAVDDQRALLDQAAAQLRDASSAAQRAADDARTDDGPAAATGYQQAAHGFASQLRVVEASRAQLQQLHAGAAEDAERARQLLCECAASLDGALRGEVQLLSRLEQLERERTVARLRQDTKDEDDSGWR